jgi:hypothetical protein
LDPIARPTQPARGGRDSCAIRRPAADSAISVAGLFSRVAALSALSTHQLAPCRYEGGRAEKNSHAAAFARNSSSAAGSSPALSRCSYEEMPERSWARASNAPPP